MLVNISIPAPRTDAHNLRGARLALQLGALAAVRWAAGLVLQERKSAIARGEAAGGGCTACGLPGALLPPLF